MSKGLLGPVAGLKVEKMMPYFMNLWSVPLAHFFYPYILETAVLT